MKKITDNQKRKNQRAKKTRTKIVVAGVNRPRLSVFRSNQNVSLQIIDDNKGVTLVSASSVKMKEKSKKTEMAFALGKEIAAKAKEKKVEKVVFDRGSYAYHGIIKAAAEGAREGGLIF